MFGLPTSIRLKRYRSIRPGRDKNISSATDLEPTHPRLGRLALRRRRHLEASRDAGSKGVSGAGGEGETPSSAGRDEAFRYPGGRETRLPSEMRVVLDTNVLVSGTVFNGPPMRVLAAWAAGRFELIASIEILAEYRRCVLPLFRDSREPNRRPASLPALKISFPQGSAGSSPAFGTSDQQFLSGASAMPMCESVDSY